MGGTGRKRTRSWASALFLAAVLAACASPTLPLPPPSLPTIGATSEPLMYRLSSVRGAIPNALVVVVNRNSTLPSQDRVNGTIADVEGSWELTIKATPGDVVDLSQEDGTVRSPSTTVTIR